MSDEIDFNSKIDEITHEISESHHKILDEFGKAYLCSLFQDGKDVSYLLRNGMLELIQQDLDGRDGKVGFRYHYRLRNEYFTDGTELDETR